jgi:hypothetical protein
LADGGEFGFDGDEIILGGAEWSADASLTRGREDCVSDGGELGSDLFDDGIEFHASEACADTLANCGIVETGPLRKFALTGPEKAQKTPVFGFGTAFAGKG